MSMEKMMKERKTIIINEDRDRDGSRKSIKEGPKVTDCIIE